MKIENVFILSAGFGTRMGKIGKELPKPLWPLFGQPLIDCQNALYKCFYREKIFCNIHHQLEIMRNHVKNSSIPFEALYEEEILDSGGAIYNLKKRKRLRGGLLISNVDQLFLFDVEKYKDFEDDIVLFGMNADIRSNYNQLVLKDGYVVDKKVGNERDDSFVTYSGVALINLDSLEEKIGPQSFFESIADFKRKKVRVIVPEQYEYLDFGTLNNYVENHYKILKNISEESEVNKFLMNEKIIKKDDISKSGLIYKSDDFYCNTETNSISLERLESTNMEKNMIQWDTIKEQI